MKKTKGLKEIAIAGGGPQSGNRSLNIDIDIESASSNFSSSKQLKSSSPSSFDQDEEIKDILDAVEKKSP